MLGDFRAHLEALDASLYEVATLADARATARAVIAGASVARWADVLLDGIADAEAPPEAAETSLIVADVGVADTGAIGFAHGPGRSRSAALLPDRQVALLYEGDVVRTMAEALARWFAGGRARAGSVVFAAGPSRTADIEQRMMLGAHGPRSLDVVLFRRLPESRG